jgi:hypothetical protein
VCPEGLEIGDLTIAAGLVAELNAAVAPCPGSPVSTGTQGPCRTERQRLRTGSPAAQAAPAVKPCDHGSDIVDLVKIGVLLVAMGGAAVLITRNRRTRSPPDLRPTDPIVPVAQRRTRCALGHH